MTAGRKVAVVMSVYNAEKTIGPSSPASHCQNVS
jgi:hypothetical protein